MSVDKLSTSTTHDQTNIGQQDSKFPFAFADHGESWLIGNFAVIVLLLGYGVSEENEKG